MKSDRQQTKLNAVFAVRYNSDLDLTKKSGKTSKDDKTKSAEKKAAEKLEESSKSEYSSGLQSKTLLIKKKWSKTKPWAICKGEWPAEEFEFSDGFRSLVPNTTHLKRQNVCHLSLQMSTILYFFPFATQPWHAWLIKYRSISQTLTTRFMLLCTTIHLVNSGDVVMVLISLRWTGMVWISIWILTMYARHPYRSKIFHQRIYAVFHTAWASWKNDRHGETHTSGTDKPFIWLNNYRLLPRESN